MQHAQAEIKEKTITGTFIIYLYITYETRPIMYSHARHCIYDYNNETHLKPRTLKQENYRNATISKSLNKDSQLE